MGFTPLKPALIASDDCAHALLQQYITTTFVDTEILYTTAGASTHARQGRGMSKLYQSAMN
ncbi:hypothetical protein GCM10008941_22770 [Rhizomicrobium palustre]